MFGVKNAEITKVLVSASLLKFLVSVNTGVNVAVGWISCHWEAYTASCASQIFTTAALLERAQFSYVLMQMRMTDEEDIF